MVSDSAKRGLEFLLTRAITSHLGVQPGDRVEMEFIPEHKRSPLVEPRFYVLTVANFFFKVLVVFHIGDDEKTTTYFSRPDSGLGFDDVFPEVCNLCCGAFNRDLGLYFPHLGMSTPYPLERESLDFVDLLRPKHHALFELRINEAIHLHASLYVCAYRPLDFRVDTNRFSEVAVEETGVLELF